MGDGRPSRRPGHDRYAESKLQVLQDLAYTSYRLVLVPRRSLTSGVTPPARDAGTTRTSVRVQPPAVLAQRRGLSKNRAVPSARRKVRARRDETAAGSAGSHRGSRAARLTPNQIFCHAPPGAPAGYDPWRMRGRVTARRRDTHQAKAAPADDRPAVGWTEVRSTHPMQILTVFCGRPRWGRRV